MGRKKSNNKLNNSKKLTKRKTFYQVKNIKLLNKTMAPELFITVFILKIHNLKWLRDIAYNMGF